MKFRARCWDLCRCLVWKKVSLLSGVKYGVTFNVNIRTMQCSILIWICEKSSTRITSQYCIEARIGFAPKQPRYKHYSRVALNNCVFVALFNVESQIWDEASFAWISYYRMCTPDVYNDRLIDIQLHFHICLQPCLNVETCLFLNCSLKWNCIAANTVQKLV